GAARRHQGGGARSRRHRHHGLAGQLRPDARVGRRLGPSLRRRRRATAPAQRADRSPRPARRADRHDRPLSRRGARQVVTGRVAIIDRVTLAGDQAMPWLDRLRAEYAPAAQARGMRLPGTWWTHADEDAIEVCLVWELAD